MSKQDRPGFNSRARAISRRCIQKIQGALREEGQRDAVQLIIYCIAREELEREELAR
jgi:hypothetical protein